MPPTASFPWLALQTAPSMRRLCFSGVVPRIVIPVGDRCGWIGNVAAECGHVEIVLDDLIGFLETGFNITAARDGIGNIAFGRWIFGAASHGKPSSSSRIRSDDGRVRLSSFEYVNNVRTNYPIAD